MRCSTIVTFALARFLLRFCSFLLHFLCSACCLTISGPDPCPSGRKKLGSMTQKVQLPPNKFCTFYYSFTLFFFNASP